MNVRFALPAKVPLTSEVTVPKRVLAPQKTLTCVNGGKPYPSAITVLPGRPEAGFRTRFGVTVRLAAPSLWLVSPTPT